MHEPSEMRFGVVRGVGRGIAVLDGGPRRTKGRGGLRVFLLLLEIPTASLLLGQFLELQERGPRVPVYRLTARRG